MNPSAVIICFDVQRLADVQHTTRFPEWPIDTVRLGCPSSCAGQQQVKPSAVLWQRETWARMDCLVKERLAPAAPPRLDLRMR